MFSFKDILSHIEQVLIESIKELNRNRTAIRPETALYLFGLALSSFFEDNVPEVDITDPKVQAQLLNSLKLGWKDGFSQTQQQTSAEVPSKTPEQPGEIQVPGGAPAGPDQLGNLPMPGGAPPTSQTLGGEPPNLENPDEEPPESIKNEKLDFRRLRQSFLNERKFNGVQLRV